MGNDIKISRHSAVVIQFPHVEILRGESEMQIDCPRCGSKSIIYSRKTLDVKISTLYCACKNSDCTTTFVMDLCLSHILSPSKLEQQNLIADMIRALPASERQLLLANF